MGRKSVVSCLWLVVSLLCAFVVSLYAATSTSTYTENFSTTTYKDATKTTADWNTALGMLKLAFVPFPPQHPLNAYTPNSSINSTYTLGYRFIPNVNGQITKLGRIAPAYPNNTLCKLWTDGGALLASGNTPNGAGWQWVALGTPVNVTAGTAYRVSLYCVGYDFLGFAYPTTIGAIQITSGYWGGGDGFPSTPDTSTMYGVPDIEFVPAGGSYNTSGVAQSLNMNAISPSVITVVFLTVSTTLPANTAITCEMTANAGTNWYQITPGVTFVIPPAGQGSDLRWRANLLTNDSTQTPLLNNLVITYYNTSTFINTTNWTSIVKAANKVTMGDNIAVISFTAVAGGTITTAHWRRFRIDETGGQPVEKLTISVYEESGNDGFFDAADKFIASGTFNSNRTCILNMNRWPIGTTAKTYYIVEKVALDGSGGQTIRVNIADGSYFDFEEGPCIGVPP